MNNIFVLTIPNVCTVLCVCMLRLQAHTLHTHTHTTRIYKIQRSLNVRVKIENVIQNLPLMHNRYAVRHCRRKSQLTRVKWRARTKTERKIKKKNTSRAFCWVVFWMWLNILTAWIAALHCIVAMNCRWMKTTMWENVFFFLSFFHRLWSKRENNDSEHYSWIRLALLCQRKYVLIICTVTEYTNVSNCIFVACCTRSTFVPFKEWIL